MSSIKNDLPLWLLRALWLITPIAATPVVRAALEDETRTVELGLTTIAWVGWGAMLFALMVPRAITLTITRIAVPLAPISAIWASVDADDASNAEIAVAIGVAGLTAVVALHPAISDRFVDGSSYGSEKRFLLRTPGALLIGPLALLWAIFAFPLLFGVVALLAERWIAGVVLILVSVSTGWLVVPAIHRLSNRWLVFVPAGVVLHDKTALQEPQLFRREQVMAIGPTPIDSQMEDLSLNSIGLALQVTLIEPTKIVKNQKMSGSTSDADDGGTDIGGFIFSPNRPGAVLAHAREEGANIG